MAGVQIAWQAENVQEAKDAFRLQKPDVIILDLQMPDGSGFDVLKEVKKECPDMTVIILTNYTIPPLKKHSMATGADYFFDKTSEFMKVFEVLKSMTEEAME